MGSFTCILVISLIFRVGLPIHLNSYQRQDTSIIKQRQKMQLSWRGKKMSTEKEK